MGDLFTVGLLLSVSGFSMCAALITQNALLAVVSAVCQIVGHFLLFGLEIVKDDNNDEKEEG